MNREPLALLLLSAAMVPAMAGAEEVEPEFNPAKDMHAREELGVNLYTAPEIGVLFVRLSKLRPLPFEALWREPSPDNYPDRLQLALNIGALIAEGFLAVESEKTAGLDTIGRLLLKRAQAMGVGDQVARHSKRILEVEAQGDWETLRKELAKTQEDVEDAMISLRDEEIAHMIALGGWLRGLEIASGSVVIDFSDERAKVIQEVDLVDYFIDRLDTLHPAAKATPMMKEISSQVKTLREILGGDGKKQLYPSDVKQIYEISRSLNLAIARKSSSTSTEKPETRP